MMVQKYRKFGGEEYFTDGLVLLSSMARSRILSMKEQLKSSYPEFKFKYRIVKVKGGYVLYTNNTVNNMRGM